MNRSGRILVAALGAIACAAAQHTARRVELPQNPPDKLDDQGLLIATIAGNSVAQTGYDRLGFAMAGVQIDGTIYANAVRENFLVLPLPPGDYKLDSLHVYRGDRTETGYPLEYPFHVSARQATNLGTILLVPQAGQQKLYWKILIDDTREATAYLKRHYPALAAELQYAPARSGENKYADGKVLEVIRRDVARAAWITSEDPNTAQYVGAEAGTIARLLRDSQGRVAAFDVLETGTTSAMISCSGAGARFVCSSAEPALYFVQGAKVERRELPAAAKFVWVHVFGSAGVVLVDEKMNLYSSNDDGTTWKTQAWYARKEPLHHLAAIHFANGKAGYYVYATFTPDPLAPQVLYSEYGRANYRRFEIPKMEDWQRLIETRKGVLLGPHRDGDSALLYFLPGGKTEWQSLPLPGKRCFFLQHEAEASDALDIFCDAKLFASRDYGQTWTEKNAAQASK